MAKIQPGARQISWASNKTLVATYSNGSIFYDLGSNSSKKLDSKIKNPVLSRAGDKLAYNYFDAETGEGNISIADPLVESFKAILPTRFENWQIGWVNNNVLSLITTSYSGESDILRFLLWIPRQNPYTIFLIQKTILRSFGRPMVRK